MNSNLNSLKEKTKELADLQFKYDTIPDLKDLNTIATQYIGGMRQLNNDISVLDAQIEGNKEVIEDLQCAR